MSESKLVERIRKVLSRRRNITEKRMFGGNCFFVNGNMIGGVTKDDELIIRVGKDDYSDALNNPHAREMDFTGRPMRGFVVVDEEGLASEPALRYWIDWGHSYAKSLPAK